MTAAKESLAAPLSTLSLCQASPLAVWTPARIERLLFFVDPSGYKRKQTGFVTSIFLNDYDSRNAGEMIHLEKALASKPGPKLNP